MASSLPPNGPSSSLRAHSQANDILQSDAAKGNVAVHSFDPDAPPAEKAAAAGKARTQLNSTTATSPEKSNEVAVDTGNAGLIPTITIQDVDKEQPKDIPQQLPGSLPTSEATGIPDWYKVGWRAFADINKPLEEEDQMQLRLMNSWISQQYYGEWYYNAAVIISAVLVSHLMTLFNLGWGWLFILLASCCTYYTTSMARVRQRARDDIQRELVKTRLASEHESAEWMNNFLDRFWLIYEPVLSATIVAFVDQTLSTNCPTFLDSIRLTQFTLGNKAPRIDKVRTFPKTAEDEVLMDWGISFTPNDVSDLTQRQLATKSNPKVVLSIRVGKGPASANLPVLVEDVSLSGLLRIRLKLMSSFPHVQVVDMCFLEKPVIDYVLKPIGGETFGFDMMNIPGLSSFIRDMIHSILGPMMYDPNVFTLNLEQLLSGAPVDAAIGVIKVTVYSARNIKANKIGGGSPDPYVSFSINNLTELTKTKYKDSTYNPTWNETKFLLINRLTDNLVLTVMDYNEHRKDTELGTSIFELSKLEEDATQEDLSLPLLKDGKERGELRFDVSYFPVLKPQAASSLEIPPTLCNPIWESATEFLCTNRASSIITVNDPVVGSLSVRLEDLLEARKEAGRDWWPLIEWKPLSMAGGLHGADQYVPPVGAVRLWLKKATDVKNVEAALGGKSDPYVRVLINNTVEARTEVINNNLNPEWDQIIYTPIHSLKETLLLEVMDYQNLTRDRSLGIVELKVSELAREADDPRFSFESTGKVEKSEPIRLDQGNQYKGQLHYVAEFLPAFALQGLRFEGGPDELRSASSSSSSSSSSSNSSKVQEVTRTITTTQPVGVPNGHTKNQQSDDSAFTAVSTDAFEATKTMAGSGGEGQSPSKKIESVDNAKNKKEGIKIRASSPRRVRLEVLLDDGYWPAFSTIRATGHRASWQHVGEGFLKELDFGQVWLRLNEADDGEKDDIFGEWKGDAKHFLSQTLGTPAKFQLLNQDEQVTGTVEIETRYVPVPTVLEARESINNQGSLRVTLLSGHDIHAVDRGGKSDPFAVFTLNGERVYKSQTKKKTHFMVTVSSRVGANFQVEIFDWNQLDQAKSLGIATERTLMLSSEKRGNKGQVSISMVFQPGIIVKSRKNTSTFSAAGRTMTAYWKRTSQRGEKDSDDGHSLFGLGAQPEHKAVIADNPGTQVSQPLGDEERLGVPAVTSSGVIGHNAPLEHGTLKVSILDAKDLIGGPDVKPYAIVRIGEKEHKTKHAGKTILQYVQPTSNSAADVSVGIKNGSGSLNPLPSGRKSSVSSPDHVAGGTLTSPSRFSLRGRRPVQDKDE
ncbi:tricalbin [Lactarius deliciosus]|nr:tricalbin [Lactarius deliciosus]